MDFMQFLDSHLSPKISLEGTSQQINEPHAPPFLPYLDLWHNHQPH